MFERMPGIVIVIVLAGAIGGFAASISFGTTGIAEQPDQPVPQVLRAQQFELIDVQGRTRGRIADVMKTTWRCVDRTKRGYWTGSDRC